MSKKYRVHNPDQLLLMPLSLRDWLPSDHLAYFMIDVVNELDISEIAASYEKNSAGAPPFEPRLMLRILLYAYTAGVYSSRQIARRLQEDVAFRVLAANSQPDFRTIAKFRKRHKAAIAGFFLQALKLCSVAGLVNVGHVALDGTKLEANASKHKAMSYGRMVEEEQRLQREIDTMLVEAERKDKDEEHLPATDLPKELAFRQKRLDRIREAKAALEAAEKEKTGATEPTTGAEAQPEDSARSAAAESTSNTEPDGDDTPPKGRKRKRKQKPGVPSDKAQRNFTDPDSRIMRGSNKQFLQGYNGQLVVDTHSQVIVAADLTNQAADAPHTVAMAKQVEENTGGSPEVLLADAGYFSAENIAYLEEHGIDAYIPSYRVKHSEWRQQSPCEEPLPENPSHKERMRAKLATPEGRAVYGLRKQSVEPVFGQIKEARGFRKLHLRGLEAAKAEWLLVCLTHNLLKLYRAKRAA